MATDAPAGGCGRRTQQRGRCEGTPEDRDTLVAPYGGTPDSHEAGRGDARARPVLPNAPANSTTDGS